MRTRITIKGQVTLPRRVREVLRLAPGDGVEFTSNERGEVVITRQIAAPRAAGHGRQPQVAAQVRRRAAELVAVLSRLD
ncbi:MAG TPA: type II toxin-antitoxin system PrlF family antitoxin [Steroidobacteraceae bacterium]|nr:type II toxin-antitoxin system PrlF family antitoxin [Steroidobacteraceae bacterium]